MESTNQNALPVGAILRGNDTYVIEKVLGAGGFGITYLASTTIRHGNLSLKVQVAIKEHFMSDYCDRENGSTGITVLGKDTIHTMVANSRKDFLAEARRLHQLGAGHNNIVKVNEVFEANGTAYYVMEYLEGQSLDAYIKANGPLDSATIRTVLTPIIDAAAYIHRNRFTHLDIKPANIMLTTGTDGKVRPVLIDFGLSKHYDESGNATSTINTCGASDGFAPVEQYQGITTFSPTADVYALGATMLNCATGRRPAPSANWSPGEPASIIDRLSVDKALKSAMNVALNHSPHNRYPDAGALLTAISAPGDGGSNDGSGNDGDDKTYVFSQPKPIPQPEEQVPEYQQQTPEYEYEEPEEHYRSLNKRGAIIGGAAIVIIGLCFFFFFRSSNSENETLEEAAIEVIDTIPAADAPVSDVASTPAASGAAQTTTAHESQAATIVQQHLEQERLEQEQLEREQLEREHLQSLLNHSRTPANLSLAVIYNGNYYYLPERVYDDLTSYQKSELNKLGVTVIGDDDSGREQRFIIALEDSSSPMNWDDAMARYGNSLPTKEQGEAWARQSREINQALIKFSQTLRINQCFWTSREEGTYAYYVDMDHRVPVSYTTKESTLRVRLVAAVPGS